MWTSTRQAVKLNRHINDVGRRAPTVSVGVCIANLDEPVGACGGEDGEPFRFPIPDGG